MADQKISQLTAYASPQPSDVFAIVDIATSTTKKLLFSVLEAALSLNNLTGTLGLTKGGTGATSASGARTALGLGALAVLSAVTEAEITLADNTTNNVSTSKHGFVPKAPNDATKVLLGDGTWGTAPGSSLTSNARAFRTTSNQSVSASSDVKVQLNGESWDTDAEFDSATNFRFTAAVTGYYQVNAAIYVFTSEDTKLYQLTVKKNGTTVFGGLARPGSSGDLQVTASDVVSLTAGDYVELYLFHDSSGSKNVAAGTGLTYMSVKRVY